MRTHLTCVSVLLIGFVLASANADRRQAAPEYTTDFGFSDGHVFLANGGNAYFSLEPGRFHRLEGTNEDGEFVEVEMTVTTKVIKIPFEMDGMSMFANARVIEEREWVDGALDEISLNFYARCPESGGIYYFGEEVRIYEDGQAVSNEGSWRVGTDGARPGLFMPPVFLLGARYYQEQAPGVALDRAEHLESGLVVKTPAGVFEDCVMVLESSDLEEDEETIKVYGKGVGLLVDEYLELVETN
jgi:hypothetical protein